MSYAITMWGCDHCGRRYSHQRSARTHERHCWKNATRTPKQGEVHGAAHAQSDDHEWVPTPGSIYVDGSWHKVSGYSAVWIGGAYEFYSEEYIPRHVAEEAWPMVDHDDESVPLNKAPRPVRVAWFRATMNTAPGDVTRRGPCTDELSRSPDATDTE